MFERETVMNKGYRIARGLWRRLEGCEGCEGRSENAWKGQANWVETAQRGSVWSGNRRLRSRTKRQPIS